MPATTVVMPRMGYDMTQAKIVRWLKHEGDRVQKGDAIAEIETEKVNIQIEAFTSGVIQKITARDGETVSVGQPIAVIGEPGEKLEEVAPAEALPEQSVGAGEGAEAPPTTVEAGAPGMGALPAEAPGVVEEERVKASPIARRLAEEQGVELNRIEGTGPGGRITKEDVQRFLTEAARRREAGEKAPARPPAAAGRPPAPAPAPPQQPAPPAVPAPAAPPEAGKAAALEAGKAAAPEVAPPAPSEGVAAETRELSRMGQAIARRMAESKRTIPHFYATLEIDMSRVVTFREELNRAAAEEDKISFNDFVLKATALALRRFPTLNASYVDGKLSIYRQVNVAMAIALENGLITPVIKDCDRKPLAEIARESRVLAAHAREGRLRQEEYEGGTFTVSNMGMLGVEEFAAIINPPQAAILAVGAVAPRPVVRDGVLAVAHTMKATISVDHRATNGAEAARFLAELKRLLEEPGRLLA